MSGPTIAGQCEKCGGWATQCNCAELPPVRVKAVVGPATCPFCDFDDCYLSERDECIVCPACGAKGPTDWRRFGDTELIPLEMWGRRASDKLLKAVVKRLRKHGDGLIFTNSAAAIVMEGMTANAHVTGAKRTVDAVLADQSKGEAQ